MAWKNFMGIKVKPTVLAESKPRYSLTADIVSFRRCPRQYGFFSARGYVPARTVQLFYGTIVHQVLDRAHRYYHGVEDPSTLGRLPSPSDIESFFGEVETALKARGIRAINPDLREQALKVLNRFNALEGSRLYPRVIETELRLEGDREQYIADGVVDVLVDAATGSKHPSQVEIWDYKGTRRPKVGSSDLKSYEYQMLVYAEFYRMRTGYLPKKAVLYFLNELDSDEINSTPPSAMYSIDLTHANVSEGMTKFDETAVAINASRALNKFEPPPPEKLADIEETCDVCDIRWSCPSYIEFKGGRPSVPAP